jgi:hypothetical protein
MSALGQKADIEALLSDVRFTPQKETSAGRAEMCAKRQSQKWEENYAKCSELGR